MYIDKIVKIILYLGNDINGSQSDLMKVKPQKEPLEVRNQKGFDSRRSGEPNSEVQINANHESRANFSICQKHLSPVL